MPSSGCTQFLLEILPLDFKASFFGTKPADDRCGAIVRSYRRIPTSAILFYFTSTSMATTVKAWEPPIRPDGPVLWQCYDAMNEPAYSAESLIKYPRERRQKAGPVSGHSGEITLSGLNRPRKRHQRVWNPTERTLRFSVADIVAAREALNSVSDRSVRAVSANPYVYSRRWYRTRGKEQVSGVGLHRSADH